MTNSSVISATKAYKALTVVSPMIVGNEKKDQDRARWFEPGQIACICDGVTSSAHSAMAAQIVTTIIPSIFTEKIPERLRMLCDLLMDHRRESQDGNIRLPKDTPDAMQDFLRKVAREKLATSFQTTMVAVRFIQAGQMVTADILKCGDSAFFAFSCDGQLLSSSLVLSSELQEKSQSAIATKPSSFVPNRLRFGPGDELLVKVVCRLAENSKLVKETGINPKYAKNWLICSPLDGQADNKEYEGNLLSDHIISLKPGDQLLVPTFLAGTPSTMNGQQYLNILYSSTIKPIYSAKPLSSITNITHHGSTTMVLPDHFYCGYCDYFQDRFPLDTHFILASDGFYSAFSNSKQLWNWLRENRILLADENKSKEILEQLHFDLRDSGGDDDISFVWVYPNKSETGRNEKR